MMKLNQKIFFLISLVSSLARIKTLNLLNFYQQERQKQLIKFTKKKMEN